MSSTGYGGISDESGSEIIMAATRHRKDRKGRRDEGLKRVGLGRSKIGKKVGGTGQNRRGSTCLTGAGVETNDAYVMLSLARMNIGTRRFATPEWSAGKTVPGLALGWTRVKRVLARA
jgi:hypothetical protein